MSYERYEEIFGFHVVSDRIYATDPCYNRDAKWSGAFPAKNGSWYACVMNNEEFIGELWICHNDYELDAAAEAKEELGFVVGVNSGRAGFFDDEGFSKFGLTAPETCAEIHEHCYGVSVPVGPGNGVYKCFVNRVDGKVIAARLDFVHGDEATGPKLVVSA